MDNSYDLSILAFPILLIVAMIYGVMRWRSRGPTKVERYAADHPRHIHIDRIPR
ncbi:MAG TPA: hypothetical protein VFS04_11470 [Alphaproteobacteria bacterium]|nr:hypothetical protein [Alphaproteobacteria bacterium]